MKMIKGFVASLFLLGVLIGCSAEVTTDENTTDATTGTEVISVQDVLKLGSEDEGVGKNYTIKGWFCGMLGSIGTDEKTLFLDQKQGSNNPAFAVLVDKDTEEALKDATSKNEITISAEIVEYTGFGTKVKAKNCKVISID